MTTRGTALRMARSPGTRMPPVVVAVVVAAVVRTSAVLTTIPARSSSRFVSRARVSRWLTRSPASRARLVWRPRSSVAVRGVPPVADAARSSPTPNFWLAANRWTARWSSVSPTSTRSWRCWRTASSSSTTSTVPRPRPRSAASTWARSRTSCPRWRPRSSTSAVVATPCSTPARSTGPSTARRVRTSASSMP